MIDELVSKDTATSEKSCAELLDAVIHELNLGRRGSEISAELVSQNWTKQAATRFCELASQISHEMKFQPESRAACARRGFEGMQSAASWIGFGACGGVMLYLMGTPTRQFSTYAIVPVLFGVVELISGLLLWWPHREFMKSEASTGTGPNRMGSSPKSN